MNIRERWEEVERATAPGGCLWRLVAPDGQLAI